MAGRDLSAELFSPEGNTGRDLSSELFGVKKAPTSTERTVGEAFKDVGAGLVSSAGSLVQLPGQLYGLATGNFSKTGSLGLGEDISKYGEEMKSAGLKAREAERAAKVQEAEKEGQFAAFKVGFGETITDPALFTSFLAEQAPNILPMILTGGATAALTAGRASAAALAKGATKEAAAAAGKSAGAKAGTTAAIQTGSVMQGADIGAGSYDEIYNELLAKGIPEEQAAAETINKARAAGLTGYGLSLLANRYLPGGKALEEILAGKKITGSRIGSGAVTALKGIPSENIEEVGGRIAQNVAARQAGLDRELLAGTGETAALATLGAAGIGGAAGALAPRRSESEQTEKAVDAFKQEEEEFRKQFGKATPVDIKEPEAPTEFPGGYTATRRELSRQDVPESFGIFAEGSPNPLTTVQTQEEAQAKLQTLSEIRAEEQARLVSESDTISKGILGEQRKLEVMEATGQTDTDQYVQSKAALLQKEEEAAQKIKDLNDRIVSYSSPLSFAPVGTRTDVQSDYVVKRGDQEIGAFPTLQDAELKLREIEPEPFKQAEQEARVKTDDRVTQLKQTLTPMLEKFGLRDVGLNVVDRIENNAGGKYLDSLIDISLTEQNPVQTMRHEALHALKDLQFFTPQQYKVLEERANKQWIKEYLQDQTAEIEVDGKPVQMSRLDAYKRLGYSQEAIVEEAIADAFGAYARGATPPPGMIAALFKKLKNFFLNFGQALRGAGFESADDVFQRVERGELKSRKPKAEKAVTKPAEEEIEKPEQTMGERLSLLRKANPDEIDISTQNPQGVKRIYDPITEMLSIDEAAVREAMKANPKIEQKIIQAIQSYGFIPNGTPDDKALGLFRENIINNLMFLYNKVPAKIRNRSKLWYDGANKIASEMANNYNMSLRQIAAIMAAMSPQKDWFQNVSMAERAIDILKTQGDQAWTPNMLKYAESYVKETKDRKEREKRGDAFEKIKKVAEAGTILNNMDEKSAAAFVRAYDEAFHSRNYRIVTPEGGFGDLVRNNDGKPSTMMWSTYGPIEKAVSIFRDGSRENVSQQLGFEHKIRSFYNNIANPNSEIDHVTIDTHAVAAALFEALAGTDTEVKQNFGTTGSSDVLGVGGTYGLIADAYREAAKRAGVRAREMQSITWEAVRALFSEEVKSTIKPKIRAEWAKYKTGQQSFDETRNNVLEIAGQPDKLDEPDWIDSGVGQFVEDGGTSYDKTFTPTDGVRLREEREIREKVTFNLSAVTKSIPGLRELYSRAMKGDDKAYELLQKVAESSLQYQLKGTGAKIKVEYSKGVYLSDREPSISVSAAFDESDQQAVMGALAKFAENYNQQQIHVRTPTIRKVGHDFGDGSYATPVYEIALRKKLNNAQISDIINQTGLQGFSVSERQVGPKGDTTTENFLTAYWVAPNDIDQEFESFDRFEQSVRAAQALAGVEGAKPKQSVERLFVYGEGPGAKIRYDDIQSDVLPKEGTDTVTPRLISEYLRGEPVKVFKQKDLTGKQVEGQKLLAKVFDELPTKDLKNPLVRSAYKALNKELVKQYNAMPVKVLVTPAKRDENGKVIDIYKNSAEMRKAISDNNTFKVYKTEPETFGPEGFSFADHPLLEDSGLKDARNEPMLFNDVLRAVHDYYAHNLDEVQFGPKGEAAAWRNHMSVTADPLARWALTTETRAQNAWQNFRDGVADIPLADRPYAEQKAMLPPIAFTFTGDANVDLIMAEYAATLTPEQQLGSLPTTSQYVDAVKKQMPKLSLRTVSSPAFKQWFGDSKIVNADGTPKVMYHGLAKDTTDFTRKTERGAPIFLTDDSDFAAKFASDSYLQVAAHPEKYLTQAQMGEGEKKAISAIRKDYGKDSFGKEMIASIQEGSPNPEAREYLQKEYVTMLPSGPHIMPLYVRAERPFDYENASHVRQVAKWYKENIGSQYVPIGRGNMVNASNLPAILKDGQWEAIETDDIQEAIKSLGFDSFYVKEHGRKNLAVYEPNQVKSATGNAGTFSRTSNDVRYSLKNVAFPSAEEAKKAVAKTSVPKTDEFKLFIAGNQWVDEDGDPKVFYHATAREFFEFDPDLKVVYLSDTPEAAEPFGKIAEDRLRQEIYRALNKQEKLDFFQRVVDDAVKADKMSEAEANTFMRKADRKIPEYGDFGDIESEVLEALIDLSPTRMSIMPLYARAETPFDFENKEQVARVMNWVRQNVESKSEFADQKFNALQGSIVQGTPQAIEQEGVQRALRRLGFDGYTVRKRGQQKSYAVYTSEQVKSVTGNLGDFSRESKDVRYSLRSFNKEDLPQKGRDYTLPQDTLLYHGAYKERADRIEEMGSVLLSRPPMRVSGGTIDEGGLIFFGDEDTARQFAENRADPMAVEGARQAGVERLTGKVFETATDRPYKLINRKYKMNAQEAKALTEALGLPDYKALDAGDPLEIATGRALDYGRSTIDRYEVTTRTGQRKETIAAPWPVIFRTLGVDGFYDSLGVALTADNGIKLVGKDGKLEKYSLPTIPQKLQDRMGETTTRAQRKTVIQSIVDAIRPTSAADFRAKYLNRYNQMSVYDKKRAEQMGGAALLADQSAESAALMSDLGAGVAASAMGFDDRNGGIPVLRNGITTIDKSVKGLIASLAPLAQHGDPAVYQRYQYWAMVKRGQRLNANGTLTGIDSADVAFAKVLEQAHPEFVSVQKDLIAFNNGVVQYMVDTGVLSQERGNMYTKYADYIPFYRQMDGDETLGPNLFQSLSGVKPPKKLKGAVAEEAPIADFLETMVRNTQSSIQAGIKNYAAQRAINVAVQVRAPGMGAVRLNVKSDAPDVINVLEKGNLVSYRTPDTLLINAMMSLNQSELPFMGFLSAPADLLRNLVTKEPGFMMANMLRDSLSAWVTSGVKMTPIAGTVINFGKAIARTSPGFEALLDAGIIGGYEFNENIEKSGFKLEDDLAKKAGKKDPIYLRPFTSVWDALGKGTTASDAATRSLIYERVLAETGNEAEALYRSLEVMNFHRKGSSPLIRVLTAAVPFFNARLQGLDVFYRASTGNMNNKDAAAIQRQFLMRGGLMAGLSVAYWFMVSDDEEYKKQEQETKDNNWIIPSIGAKIPIPFEVGVLFKVIPERIAAYLYGNDTGEDLKKSMLRSVVNTFAFNPIPQTIKPVLEAYVDYNMFTMRPILSQGMKDIEPEFQVGPGTSKVATGLAQGLGLSPIKVDHILKGYTGTIGMYLIDTVDAVLDQFGDSPKPTKRFEQLPVIKRFVADPEARGYVTQFYELKNAVDTTVRTMNLLEKTGQTEDYIKYVLKNQGPLALKDDINNTEKKMTELREMKTAVRSSSMDGDEKRDALLAISQMESALTSNIQEIKKTIASVQ